MQVRIKDIVTFEGVRDNQLVGYGLVVGLNKTGDRLQSSPFTQESIVSMLERLGVNVRGKNLGSHNVAAVMVTADLPPFARQGSRIDVTVSSIGDAKDLRGGTLLVTPLLGADGEVYAVSQGAVANGGFHAKGKAGKLTKGVPTSGRIANGAIIEKEIGFDMATQDSLRISLRNPDFTTSMRIAEAINTFTKGKYANSLDSSTVKLSIPPPYKTDISRFLSQIEQLKIAPDQRAKIIIDEQNGVIVMGENVRISTVAISHGNLTIRVQESPQVSQPNPFSEEGETTVVDRTEISVLGDDQDKNVTLLPAGVSLQEVVNAMNSLGVSPQDMITILRTIKASGALQAEIEVI